MSGCVLVALCSTICQTAPPPDDAGMWRALGEARDTLAASIEKGDTGTGTRLRYAATLVLSGEYRHAEQIASALLAEGALAPQRAAAAATNTLGAVFSSLLAKPADAARALVIIGREYGPDRPDAGDIAWPFAKAFALARAGESHRAASTLEALADRLRKGAGLQVRSIRLVKSVASFGVYEDDARSSVRPGDTILVYAEPQGFVATPGHAGAAAGARWRIRLEMTVQLLDRADGTPVASWGPDAIDHDSRAQVRDLHVTRLVDLPRDLENGTYELRLRLVDKNTPDSRGLGVVRLTINR